MKMRTHIIIVLLGISLIGMLPHIQAQTFSDVYVDSKTPTRIPWSLTSINSNYTESFYCDKTPSSTFNLGKTIVRCVEIKSDSENIRSSFVVTVGYKIVQIPEWFKIPTTFWNNGMISDAEYFTSVEKMIQKGYISIPQTKMHKQADLIPVWIHENSKKWTSNSISDDEFSIGLQWLIQNGFIKP
ncbi:MAG: plastocyanin [Nitrosopumilaceae archaeon]|nr:plastocyanin [Nitrosopumilaceae archaeon]